MTFFKKSLALVIVIVFFALMFSCSHEHEFGEWEISMQPTCVEGGERIRTCTSCGEAESESVPMLLHDELQHEGKAATCTEDGCTSYVTCSRCDYTTYQKIEALGHNEVYHESKEPNCNESGWKEYVTCSVCDYSTYKEIPKLAHVMAEIPEKPATCTEEGLTEGIYCTLCNRIMRSQKSIPMAEHTISKGHCTVCGVEDYTHPDQYASRLYYNELAHHKKGQAMQAVYDILYEKAKAFHLDYSVDIDSFSDNPNSSGWIPGVIDVSEYNLTDGELELVRNAFEIDNPIFYWFVDIPSPTYVTSNDVVKKIRITVSCDYLTGEARKSYDKQIADKVKYYYSLVEGETSEYQIALCIYQSLLKNLTYAHETLDKIGGEYEWTQNIIGALCYNHTVCAGYGRAFAMLLNFSGVEARAVTGDSIAGGHLWAMAKMDDGNWYWFDPTWDDNTSAQFVLRYFCVNDTQKVNWFDVEGATGTVRLGTSDFLDSHVIDDSKLRGRSRNYRLPNRSSVKFSSSEILELRETFTVDELTYALVGYREVQLVGLSTALNVLKVPQTVKYNGIEYTVIGVGAITEDGYFDGGKSITSG